MPSTILNTEQKAYLIYAFERGAKQKDLANHFNVSRKTVYRALKEAGALISESSLSADSRKILRMTQNHHVTPEHLSTMLNHRKLTEKQSDILTAAGDNNITNGEMLNRIARTPALTTRNVAQLMIHMAPQELDVLMETVYHERANLNRAPDQEQPNDT